MKNLRLYFLFFSGILLLSCNEPQQRIARSVGATSEILVVTQNLKQWQGSEGEALRAYFEQDQYGLPQSEPIFKLTNINVVNLSEMFKKHRNLIVVEIDPKLDKAVVETRSDLWSKPQRVIKITAPDTISWMEAFDANKEGFKILFDRSERERLMNIFKPTAKLKVMEPIQKKFGVKLIVPEGFYVAKDETNFLWVRKETNDFSQALIFYSIPYRDTLALTPQQVIRVRDSVVKQHIPGPSAGSFMSTDKEFILPQVKNTIHFITDFAVETRGVWNVEGDFMAGPFVSYTIIDQRNSRLLTLEGYVYAPNKPKRDHLRQLEAILYSLEIEE
ncbi:MAG: hypothetical protein CVT92_09945 [Bacteroidetes bacterium HGW-Bacteroidetes-1]|jgi:hypothetical protein|nr:MAG: hypothetical protein CVT92_09945 [Bacteroidetes bacterium HGW-Bacteroidetes-1]